MNVETLPYLTSKPSFGGSGTVGFIGKYFETIKWEGYRCKYTQLKLQYNFFNSSYEIEVWFSGHIDFKSDEECWPVIIHKNLTTKVLKLVEKEAFERGRVSIQNDLKRLFDKR